MPYSNEVIQRFWRKVDKSGECWEWIASETGKGYGGFWDGERRMRAHRVAWIIEHGDIKDDLLVLHKCDNRRCVRPDHLFLGSARDNVLDMWRKGRASLIPRMRLQPEEIIEIRSLYEAGIPTRAIGRRFNLDSSNVSKIGRRISRSDVA